MRRELLLLRNWFSGFSSSFYLSNPEDQQNIILKQEHTCRVCANIRQLVRAESLGDELGAVAEAIALLHDIGRFPQYHRYRTFKDSDSVNHGTLAAELLTRGKILDKWPRNEQDVIIQAVGLHNAFALPPQLDPETELHLKLIRDADKLDIWRVFLEFYRLAPGEGASAVALGLPDTPECSPDVVDTVCDGRLVDLETVNSINDFKLLQLSWVYDLNFPASFAMVCSRGYIDGLEAMLPPRENVRQAVSQVRRFAARSVGVTDA